MVRTDPWINAMTTKKTCDRLYRECAAVGGYANTRSHPQTQIRQRQEQQFEGHEDVFYRVDSETGWKYYLLATKEAETKTRGDSYQTPRVQVDDWIRQITAKKQRRRATSCTRSMQQLQDVEKRLFILKNKSDKDQTNNSKGTKGSRIGLTHQLGGSIMFLRH